MPNKWAVIQVQQSDESCIGMVGLADQKAIKVCNVSS